MVAQNVPASLPDEVRPSAERYVARLNRLAGKQLLAAALYGVGLPDFLAGRNLAAQNVLVLERVDLDLLRRLATESTALARANFAAPLIMTPAYIEASRDTFPLELIEIQQQHLTLTGPDLFAPLAFEPSHVRLQCERELKTVLIGMHQRLLVSQGSEALLGVASRDVADALLRVLRGLVWLADQREARPPMQLVAAAERLVGRKLPGVYAALDDADTAGWHKFQQLYEDVQALGHFADVF